jgi:cation:H+ antiporter
MLPLIALSTSVSFLLIYLGAKNTMTGAINLGNSLKLQKAVTGSILVATVTALPELSSSLITMLRGSPSMALGNILGTNIYNLPLIVGLAGMFSDVKVIDGVARQCAYLLGVNVLIYVAASMFGSIQPWMGVLLIGLYVVFIADSLRQARTTGDEGLSGQLASNLLPLVAGGAVLVLGSYLLVDGATWVMDNYRLGAFVVGLIMSFGPIIPELAVSLFTTMAGEHEVSFGNVLGDNIITATLVLGLVTLTNPIEVSAIELGMTIPFTLIFTVLVYIISKHKIRVTRRVSALMLLLAAATFLLQFSVLS